METDQLKNYFRQVRVHGSMVSGIRQVIKSLESKQGVKLVFLAKDCDEKKYSELVKAMCKKHGISLIEKFPRKQLGELAGQFRLKGTITEEKTVNDRKPGKVVNASCLAITNFGRLTEEDQKSLNELLQ